MISALSIPCRYSDRDRADFAVLVPNASVTGSLERLAIAVAGHASTQVTARDSRGVDERVRDAVAHVGGVRTAAAMLEQQSDLKGPSGTRSINLVGVTPERGHRAGRPGLSAFVPGTVLG